MKNLKNLKTNLHAKRAKNAAKKQHKNKIA